MKAALTSAVVAAAAPSSSGGEAWDEIAVIAPYLLKVKAVLCDVSQVLPVSPLVHGSGLAAALQA